MRGKKEEKKEKEKKKKRQTLAVSTVIPTEIIADVVYRRTKLVGTSCRAWDVGVTSQPIRTGDKATTYIENPSLHMYIRVFYTCHSSPDVARMQDITGPFVGLFGDI